MPSSMPESVRIHLMHACPSCERGIVYQSSAKAINASLQQLLCMTC